MTLSGRSTYLKRGHPVGELTHPRRPITRGCDVQSPPRVATHGEGEKE